MNLKEIESAIREFFFLLWNGFFRYYECNNYPKIECGYKTKGYKIRTWHKGQNFVVPACPKCKDGVLI